MFLYKYFAIPLIKLTYVHALCLTMMVNWCFVTNNIKISLLFLLFLSYSLPLNFISVDVFLFFDDLGIFDCIVEVIAGTVII